MMTVILDLWNKPLCHCKLTIVQEHQDLEESKDVEHGANTDAENEKTEPTRSRYFIRPSIDNLKSFFDFHPHQPRADVPFNTERASAVQFALPSEKVPTRCSLVTLTTRSISIGGFKNTNNARHALLMLKPSWSISQNA